MAEKNKIFVDSNFYIAFYNLNDSRHAIATRIGRQIETEAKVITNLVFLEIVTVLSQRVDRQIAIKVGDFLSSSSTLEIIHTDEYLHQESWRVFKQILYKNISFVDCSIIAAMNAEGIDKLLTFDEDFKKLKKYHKFNFYAR